LVIKGKGGKRPVPVIEKEKKKKRGGGGKKGTGTFSFLKRKKRKNAVFFEKGKVKTRKVVSTEEKKITHTFVHGKSERKEESHPPKKSYATLKEKGGKKTCETLREKGRYKDSL